MLLYNQKLQILIAQYASPSLRSRRESTADFVVIDSPKRKQNRGVCASAVQQPLSLAADPGVVSSAKRSMPLPALPPAPTITEWNDEFASSADLAKPPIPPLPPPIPDGNGRARSPNHGRHKQRQPSLTSIIFQAEDNSIRKLLKAVLVEREKTVEQRINIDRQKKDLEAQIPLGRAAYDDVLSFLRTIVPSILESTTDDNVKTALQQKWAVFESFSTTLDNWHKRLQADESDLAWRQENKLLSKEEELYKRIKDMDLQLILEGDDASTVSHIPPHLLRRTSTYSTSSTSSSNSVQREYYHTIGEINLLREAIFNLESDFHIAKRKRIDLEGSGQPLEFPDSQLYADYFQQREEIIKNYYIAKANMEHLRKQCQDEGLKVEPPNLPPFLDQVFKEDADAVIESKTKRSPALRRENIHVLKWLQDVRRSAETVNVGVENMTEGEADSVLSFPRYERLQVSEESTRSLDKGSATQPPPKGSSFQGEVPTDRRRYSAPELRSLSREGHEIGFLDDQIRRSSDALYSGRNHHISRSEASRPLTLALKESDQLESLRLHGNSVQESHSIQESRLRFDYGID
jgi:hypothetical protein